MTDLTEADFAAMELRIYAAHARKLPLSPTLLELARTIGYDRNGVRWCVDPPKFEFTSYDRDKALARMIAHTSKHRRGTQLALTGTTIHEDHQLMAYEMARRIRGLDMILL